MIDMAKIEDLNVNGLSLEDIRLLNTRNLSNKALKQALNRLVSGANKRIRRLSKDPLGQYSPSAGVRKFSSRGLTTRNEIKAEFERARAFLDPSKKSHTLKGWRQISNKMMKKGVTKAQLSSGDFWSMFRRFYSRFVPLLYDSDSLLSLVSGLHQQGKSEDQIHDYLINRYEEEYEEADNLDEFEDVFGEFYE